MNEVILISASVGLTNILKYGSILKTPRNAIIEKNPFIKELFSCSMCLGFWSGILIGLIGYFYLNINSSILLPLASSVFSQFFDYAIDAIDGFCIYISKKNDETKEP